MHTAQVLKWGEAPKYIEAPEPEAALDSVQIKVLGAGLHHLVRSRASGKHYSSKSLPHTPGVDGVGVVTAPSTSPLFDKRVYFSTFATGGSYADVVSVPARAATALPNDVEAQQAAAMVNPALSSWMALRTRTGESLPKGFTVLIMGVTSASGMVAIEVARALGAGKVIGIARSAEKLTALGLDETIVLKDPVAETDFEKVGEVDVVLDYIYGKSTLELFNRLKTPRKVEYVHIGSVGGELEVSVPGAVLRSKNLTIRGSGPGAWSIPDQGKELPQLLEAMGKMKKQPVKVVKLADVERVWGEAVGDRVCFVP